MNLGSARLANIACVVLLFVLVLAFFHEVVFSDKLIYGQDIIEQGYPLACFSHNCIKHGYAPIWNPYMMSGMPMYSSRPMYILGILNPYFSPRLNVNLFIYVLHTALGCLFMFALMRRWGASRTAAMVSATAFAFSGFFVPKIYAGHGGAFMSGVWIPLVFLLLDVTIATRSPVFAALTGGAYGTQVLGQHPQYVFYTLLAMTAFTIYRVYPLALRPFKIRSLGAQLGLVGIIGLFALGISAVYTLPFAQLTSLSSRGGGTGYAYSSSLSLPPANLITTFSPNFWGSPVYHNSVWGALYWDASLYVGIIPLMLALIAFLFAKRPHSAFFKWLAVAAILVALGGHTPLYRILYHVPGFSLMRVPSKALILYAFAMAVLAGFGLDTVIRSDERLKRKIKALLIVLIALATITAVGYFAAQSTILNLAREFIMTAKANPEQYLRKLPGLYTLQTKGFALSFLFTALGAALIWIAAKKGLSKAVSTAIVGLAFVDLAIFGAPLVRTVDHRAAYRTNASEVAFFKSQTGQFRILPLQHSRFPYAIGTLTGVQNVNGYFPIILRRYAVFVAAVNNQPMKVDVSADIANYKSPLLDLLNVRYVLSKKPLTDRNLKQVHRGRTYIYERETLPRAFIVHSVELAPNGEAALRRVKAKGFDAKKRIIIESELPIPDAEPAIGPEAAVVVSYKPRRVDLSVQSSAPGYLFLSEVYYPGWRATIDGEATPVLQANYLFRSIYIPPGKHAISFVYDPPLRAFAKKISISSAFALLGVCLAGLAMRLRRRIA